MKFDTLDLFRRAMASVLLTLIALLPGCGSSPESAPRSERESVVEVEAGSDLAESKAVVPSELRSAFHESPLDSSADDADIIAASATSSSPPTAPPGLTRSAPKDERSAPGQEPVVRVETNQGNITIRLFPDRAPQTVANFLENYVARRFYDETIVHHVERDFMIAAGGYGADLEAKPTRAWIRNESRGGLSNLRGTVAMAHLPGYPDSATSQFFINLADNPSLDYQAPVEESAGESFDEGDGEDVHAGYCVFGEVIDGMEIVDRIAEQEVESSELFPNLPVDTVIIRSIRRIQ